MESTRRYTKLPPVCRNTLRANMEGVTKAVEIKIGNEMPDKFGLLLDGWTHGTEHYLGVFACYETPSGPKYPLLSLAPIVVDAAGRFDAETHMAVLAAGDQDFFKATKFSNSERKSAELCPGGRPKRSASATASATVSRKLLPLNTDVCFEGSIKCAIAVTLEGGEMNFQRSSTNFTIRSRTEKLVRPAAFVLNS
ncbi:hypothetical protein F444_02246 [Phytophthora nicotianae P1976]|uniref:Uncharacterized protein n=1 Tax=Phytophthora nicotianae P1976 TaxID=1317066 RepID=A0A081AY41_PHYNI|nr:hypothetical protein F444_02246 [Phytophthora nicotianae P1976]